MPNLIDLTTRIKGILWGPNDVPDFTSYIAPDGETLSAGTARGDRLGSGVNVSYYVYGDAVTLDGTATGGRDQLFGSDNAKCWLFGDAGTLQGTSRGGNDQLSGGSGLGGNSLFGDAMTLTSAARGGNDIIVGGNDTTNGLIGDAGTMDSTARGGNDTLRGGGGSSLNLMAGDAEYLGGAAICGNDRLFGGSTTRVNHLCGDAFEGTSTGLCGDDLLVAGSGSFNILIGDVSKATGSLICGDDRLVAGTGFDQISGDIGVADPGGVQFGRDTFVFTRNTGQDLISDFQPGLDHIEIRGIRDLRDFGDLVTTPNEAGTGLIVHLDGANFVELASVTTLGAGDVIFR